MTPRIWSRLTSALARSPFSRQKAAPRDDPDSRFGTGLWRQHRDRFTRAVDRFYATAVELRGDADAQAGATDTRGKAGGTDAAAAAELVAQQTLVLNDLADRIDALTADLHARHRVDGLILPAQERAELGQLPELLSRAGAKVAEACQAAAMARIAVRTGQDPSEPARAAAAYVADAATLVDRCRAAVGPDAENAPDADDATNAARQQDM